MEKTRLPSARPDGIDAPWTPAGHADPYAWMAYMTVERPVALDERTGIVHFTGYQAVHDFLRDAEIWSTAKRLEYAPPDMRHVRLLLSDPPVHGVLRSFFSRSYRPRRIAAMADRIRAVARELAAAVVEKGTFDLTSEFAAPLTATMICALIGIPAEDQEQFVRSSQDVGAALGPLEGPTADARGALGSYQSPGDRWLERYFLDLIEARREDPRDDLVSELAKIPAHEIEGQLDIAALLNEQVGAGQSTTTHLLGSTMYLLTEHPDQACLLVEDYSRIPSAVEESVRLSAPLTSRPRIATQTVDVAGLSFPEGTTGMGWTQAANLDPERFPDPLRYDVGRSPNPHISFGFGEHFCLGSSLARLEVKIALEELLTVGEYSRVDPGPPDWVEDYVLRGPKSLPLHVAAR
jgi:cytochrome P450